MKDVSAALQVYEQDYLNQTTDTQETAKLEQDFYQKHNIWVTTVDTQGNLKYTDDFFMEVKLRHSDETMFSNKTMTIPLYSVIDVGTSAVIIPSSRLGLKKGKRSPWKV